MEIANLIISIRNECKRVISLAPPANQTTFETEAEKALKHIETQLYEAGKSLESSLPDK